MATMLPYKGTVSSAYNCLQYTVKPVYNGHSKIDKTKILITFGSLMKVKVLQNAAFCNTFDLH